MYPNLPRILVLPPWTGGIQTVTPSRIIAGSNTQLGPEYNLGGGAIAADSAGDVYVAQGQSAVLEFASGANGNTAPIRTFPVKVGGGSILVPLPNTGLVYVTSVATDNQGNLYVLNMDENRQSRIEVFGPNQNGDVAPLRTIFGPSTGMDYLYPASAFTTQNASSIAVDSTGNVYAAVVTQVATPGAPVVTYYDEAILVFPAGANGDAAPIRIISGDNTSLNGTAPGPMCVDGGGNLYISAEYYSHSILYGLLMFGAGANGNVVPEVTVTTASQGGTVGGGASFGCH